MNDDWTTMVEDVLASLPRPNPDAVRSQRVRTRCHKKLTRPPRRRTVEAAVVGSFCAVYLWALLLMALRTHAL